MSQRDMFDAEPAPAARKRRTQAPDALSPPQWKALEEWAERTVPWIRRGALESFDTLEQHVEEILEWWQANGGLKVDWLRTVQNRIRHVERARLRRLAAAGNMGARDALRDPVGWASTYDARIRVSRQVAEADGGGVLHPSGGGQVFHLGKRDRGRRGDR